jgi:hypothetical protein
MIVKRSKPNFLKKNRVFIFLSISNVLLLRLVTFWSIWIFFGVFEKILPGIFPTLFVNLGQLKPIIGQYAQVPHCDGYNCNHLWLRIMTAKSGHSAAGYRNLQKSGLS